MLESSKRPDAVFPGMSRETNIQLFGCKHVLCRIETRRSCIGLDPRQFYKSTVTKYESLKLASPQAEISGDVRIRSTNLKVSKHGRRKLLNVSKIVDLGQTEKGPILGTTLAHGRSPI